MAEIYSIGAMFLKGVLSGGSGLLLAMAATNDIKKGTIFSNVTAAIISAFLITIMYENYWILGEQFLVFVGFYLTAVALIAIANFLRNPEEEQLAASFSLFASGVLGVIIGLNMVTAGFVAILLITIILQIGKMLIKEK